MIINSRNSQNIAYTIGMILNKNVNIMNEEGIIVASTDPTRIQTFHQGAKDLIEKDVAEIDIYSDDNISGAKEGINVPIILNGHTKGVIGVTGPPDELRDISLVIGEMASIFFMQSIISDNLGWELKKKRYFWEELLFSEHPHENKEFVRRGKEIGIFVEQVKSVVQIYLPLEIGASTSPKLDSRMIAVLEKHLGSQTIVSNHRIGERLIFLLSKQSTKALESSINKALTEIREQLHITVYGGISSGCENYTHIHKTYLQAESSLDLAIEGGILEVCVYEEMILDILLSNVNKESRKKFLERVFQNISEEEYQQIVELLKVFYKCNGSISKMSEKLFLHKNTVQYKLKKVHEMTGYDPRDLRDSVILNICLHIQE